MRVLVTGATGFIGRTLIPRLVVHADTAVTLLVRETYSGQPLPEAINPLRSQLELVYADLRNYQLTVRALREAAPDVILHMAAVGSTTPFIDVHTAVRHNVSGMLNLLRASFEKSSGVRQLVVCRTPGELTAMNNYAASKLAAWDFCRMYARTQQWPIVGAMIYQAYGPCQAAHTLIPSAMQAALAGKDFPMTTGSQERDWIYVDDVADGLIAVQRSELEPGTTVDIGTGVSTSVADVVRHIYELVGGNGRPLIGALPSRPGEALVQAADCRRTRALTGWEPAVGLRDGLRAVMEQYRSP